MNKTKNYAIYLSLIVLIILSIVFTTSGAWFTDSAKADVTADINFATVDINFTNGKVTKTDSEGKTITRKIVPGDKFTLSGDVTNNSNVEIYYIVKCISTKLIAEANGETYDISSILKSTTTKLVDADGNEIAPVYTVGNDKLYKMTSASDKATHITETTIDENTGNFISVDDATAIILNENGETIAGFATNIRNATFKLVTTITVVAIQADNNTTETALNELLKISAGSTSGDDNNPNNPDEPEPTDPTDPTDPGEQEGD